MKLKDLESVLHSHVGQIQWAVLWDGITGEIIVDDCSIDYAIKHYPDVIVEQIKARNDDLVIAVIAE